MSELITQFEEGSLDLDSLERPKVFDPKKALPARNREDAAWCVKYYRMLDPYAGYAAFEYYGDLFDCIGKEFASLCGYGVAHNIKKDK